jgi:oligopeptidase A
VRARVAVVKPPEFNRFAHSFLHVFAGGYAAGYYSYKWAEVLAADAFAAFEEHGIFDAATARRFLGSILERGGSRDAMEAFVEFRGRPPEIEPLLRQFVPAGSRGVSEAITARHLERQLAARAPAAPKGTGSRQTRWT